VHERQDLPDLDDRPQPPPAAAGADRPGEAEGYTSCLTMKIDRAA
jgi:hypothetical protein